MKPSKILVFGNPRVKSDSVPLKIIKTLKKEFPEIKFEAMDPTEIINQNEKELWILDTVQGVDNVTIVDDSSMFTNQANLSVHDYDLALDLKLLLKLGKVQKIRVIAIPQDISKEKALEKVSRILSESGF